MQGCPLQTVVEAASWRDQTRLRSARCPFLEGWAASRSCGRSLREVAFMAPSWRGGPDGAPGAPFLWDLSARKEQSHLRAVPFCPSLAADPEEHCGSSVSKATTRSSRTSLSYLIQGKVTREDNPGRLCPQAQLGAGLKGVRMTCLPVSLGVGEGDWSWSSPQGRLPDTPRLRGI